MNKNETISWSDAYKYASELVDDGVFTKFEINKEFNNSASKTPEDIYNWLARVATERHVSKLNLVSEADNVDVAPEEKPKLHSNKTKLIRAIGASVTGFSTIATLNFIKDNEDLKLSDAPLIWIGSNIALIGLAIISSQRN